MNGILKNMKCAYGTNRVAESAAISISNIDFIAGPFGSAFFLQCHPERSRRIQDGFTPYVILGAKRRGSRGAFILEFN
jgi:hypothetical protein